MASWYRRFIPGFATTAAPLTRLMKKTETWLWSEEQAAAFEALKQHLASAPTLACPDFALPFTLQTDASNVGLGAVLTQVIDGEERVIAYASRALTAAEKKYTVTELECLAVIWSINKFWCYLEGYSFTVITDHSSLRWLHNLRNPTGRLARWALGLLEYNFEIIHRKGALHHVPDALSRAPDGESLDTETIAGLQSEDVPSELMDASPAAKPGRDRWYWKKFRNVQRAPDLFPDWKIVKELLYMHRPSDFVTLEMEDRDGWKLVLPQHQRAQAIAQCHESPQAGHLGVDKTYRRLYTSYYWPNMFRDVVAFVRHSDTCQRCKVEQAPPRGLMGRRIIQGPWDTIAADIVGPITRSKAGFSFILVVQDLFTRWVEVIPLRRATEKTIRESLEKVIISRWGTPRVFFSDNGTEFVNREIKSLMTSLGTKHETTPPYHPQANPVERVNRVLKTMLRAFIESDHRTWDEHLHDFQFAFNTAYHESLQATPAFANFGREPLPAISLKRELEGELEIVPGNVQEWVERMKPLETLRKTLVHAITESSNKQAHQYNLRCRNVEFQEGDLVMRRSHPLSSAAKQFSAALVPPFGGPFIIDKKLSKVRYSVVDFNGKAYGEVAIQDLKPYVRIIDNVLESVSGP
uniref:RNA-directed DNA polymerase n=1 Tax=Bracon brevicornis TaxID=1563983 RepID=A0A6V7LWV3_9HYME